MSGGGSGSAGEGFIFGCHLYFFAFFDEEGNANGQSSLKPGEFGHSAARRIAPGAGEKVEFSTENREYESGAIFSDGVSCESSLPVGEEGEEA